MEQFALVNGDLVLNGTEIATVTGVDKLKQDLSLAAQYPYQSDPFHPTWGSLLDNYIGLPANPTQKTLVYSEMMRVLNNYMSVKISQLKAATGNSQKSPFSPQELVKDVTSITVLQYIDAYVVNVTLQTFASVPVHLTVAVTP